MKKITIASSLLFTLLSCNRAGDTLTSTEYITISPRITRAQTVNDSIWNLAASVHIKLSTTSGISLLDDTVLFSKRKSPSVTAPSDQGIIAQVEGLSNTNTIVWSGSLTLPPSTRDTTFAITINSVNSNIDNLAPLGTVNSPIIDSFSVEPWGSNDTFDQPIHIYFSTNTPNAKIHYTLDGSYPTLNSPIYSDTGLYIDSSTQIKAISTLAGWTNSSLISKNITLKMRSVIFDTTYNIGYAPFKIGMHSLSPNSEIFFTKDSIKPTQKSSIYHDSLQFNTHDDSCQLMAITYNSIHKKIQASELSTKRVGLRQPWNRKINYDSILDSRDGAVYRTVKIGAQTWFAENLRYKTLNSRCSNYQGIDSICGMYGREYSWAEAMGIDTSYNRLLANISQPTQGICPQGFHVPSDNEWSILVKSDSIANRGINYLSVGNGYVGYSNIDTLGFRGISLAGCSAKFPDGSSVDGTCPGFWTSTQNGATSALSRLFIGQYITRPTNGGKKYSTYNFPVHFNVRCIKN